MQPRRFELTAYEDTPSAAAPEARVRVFLPAVAAGILAMVVLAVVAIARIGYPFDLEWMEGSVVDHVARVADGRPLYVEPGIGFVPLIYTPLYYYLSAVPYSLLGGGYAPLRALSLACSFLSILLVGLIAGRVSGRIAGFLAAGFFAASYGLSGTWFDLARVDALFLALLLLSVSLFQRGTARGSGALLGLSGAALAASCLAKQSGLLTSVVLVAACALWPGLSWKRHRAVMAGTFLTVLLVPAALLQSSSGGWFSYYVLELPSRHELILHYLAHGFWIEDLLLRAPLLLVSALLVSAATLWSRPGADRARRVLMLAVLWSMVACSWMSRAKSGGYLNVLMPGHAALAVLGAAGLVSVRRSRRLAGRGRQAALGALALAQVVYMVFALGSPLSRIPDRTDLLEGQRLLALISGFEGEVLVPYHSHYPVMAGKSSLAHDMAICDVIRAGESEGRDLLLQDMAAAFESGRFDAIILDDEWFLGDLMEHAYERVDTTLFEGSPEAFWPVTGMQTRPQALYLRRAAGR
ncbi:glycosyltransferase family 39 protein [Candidatus Fermentibacterales bacterium]|nr:glycosyltransferase family 39 protein [Candidatus Fermentibacterales bacterium]